jgi:hypothetical protein
MSNTITIVVTIEWPTGSEVAETEVPADATDAEMQSAAEDVFFNVCNFGWRKKDDDGEAPAPRKHDCGVDGHRDPDNSGVCIHCDAVLHSEAE